MIEYTLKTREFDYFCGDQLFADMLKSRYGDAVSVTPVEEGLRLRVTDPAGSPGSMPPEMRDYLNSLGIGVDAHVFWDMNRRGDSEFLVTGDLGRQESLEVSLAMSERGRMLGKSRETEEGREIEVLGLPQF